MKFNVRQIAKKKRRTAVKLAPIKPMQVQVNSLNLIILKVLKRWISSIRNHILPAYGDFVITKDDAQSILKTTIAASKADAENLVLTLEIDVDDWATRLEEWHRRRFAQSIDSALDVSVFPFLDPLDVAEEIGAAVARNVALIKGLSDDVAKQVENVVWTGFINQTPRTAIGKQLSERFDIARRRANFIAADQTIKLAGDLNQLRQQQAGIDQFIWRHSGKAHYRPEHRARDGKIFSWNKLPADGKPGSLPNCGCTAQGYVAI